MSNFEDVKAFHEKFGLIANDQPRQLSDKLLKERIEFLWEELKEFTTASDVDIFKENFTCKIAFEKMSYYAKNIADQADALIDIVYVAMGTAVMMGLPWQELWDDVHKRNMEKVKAQNPTDHHDVIKPDGWSPPITGEILLKAGYGIHDEEVG